MNWLKKMVGVSLVVMLVAGCMAGPQPRPELKPRAKVGLSLMATDNDRDRYIKNRLEDLAREDKIILVAKDSGQQWQKQRANIEALIEDDVQGVILQPVDDALTRDHLTLLQEQDIKVLAIDSLPANSYVDGFISNDYLRAGELQAQFILSAGEQENILIIQDGDSKISEAILQGNLNILRNNTLVDNLVIEKIPRKDKELVRGLAIENLTSVIVHSDLLATELLAYLEENHRAQGTKVVTLSANKEWVEKMVSQRNNNLATVDTMPNLVAQLAIKAVQDLIQNDSWEYDLQIDNGIGNVPTKIVPVRLITKENLYLLQERYKEAGPGNSAGEEQNSNSEGNSSQNSDQSGGQNSQNGGGNTQFIIKVVTKEGDELEFTVPGEIESLEIAPKEE